LLIKADKAQLASDSLGLLPIATSKAKEIEKSDLLENDPLLARTLMSWGNIYLDESTEGYS
jgi:hypothetical protein